MLECFVLKEFQDLFSLFCKGIGFFGVVLNIFALLNWADFSQELEKYKSENMFLIMSSAGERMEKRFSKRKNPRQD